MELTDFSNKTFLVTGAKGMLGSAFVQVLRDRARRVIALSRDEWDVRQPAHQDLANQTIDYVLHCAGLVDADRCESDPELCRDIHLTGTLNAWELSRRTRAKFFFPQSFLIYGNSEEPVDESTIPVPVSVYGITKLEAEKRLLALDADALVVRMGGFFGGGVKDKNFVGKFARYLKTVTTPSIEVGDRIWQPSYTVDLAANCLEMLGRNCSGVYCMAGHGSATFFDVAKFMVEELGYKNIEVKQVPSQFVEKQQMAVRPQNLIMSNAKLRSQHLDMQRSWRESLRKYLAASSFSSTEEARGNEYTL